MRMLDTFEHHERDIKPSGALKKAHERLFLSSRTWLDDGREHDWVQVSIRTPLHGTSQEQGEEQPKPLQLGPTTCWDSLGSVGVPFSSQEGTNADGVVSVQYSFGQLPEAVILFRTDAQDRLLALSHDGGEWRRGRVYYQITASSRWQFRLIEAALARLLETTATMETLPLWIFKKRLEIRSDEFRLRRKSRRRAETKSDGKSRMPTKLPWWSPRCSSQIG